MQRDSISPLRVLTFMLLATTVGPVQGPLAQGSASDSAPASDKVNESLFAYVASIGASMSSGFGNNLPPAKVLDKAITVEHRKLEPANGLAFFMSPVRIGVIIGQNSQRHHAAVGAKSLEYSGGFDVLGRRG